MIIVVAITLVVGFKAVNSLMGKQSQVELISFYNDLDREVKKIYNLDEGSSDKITLNLPSSIKQVCFTTNQTTLNVNSLDAVSKSIINNNYKSKTRKNVFTLPVSAVDQNKAYYFIKNLEVSTNPVCIQTKGTITFTLQNKGEVYIS